MLERIETMETLTTFDAVKKYPTKYLIMVITDVVDQGDNDVGYVLYTADSMKDWGQISRDEMKGKKIAFMEGWSVEPPNAGRIIYYD